FGPDAKRPDVGSATRLRGEAARLLDARVVDRFQAFLRGSLRGGRVDEFFIYILPRLELTEDSVLAQLSRDAGDLLGELGAPLRASLSEIFRELEARAA